MPTYRAQVVFPMFTNMPEDVITNTFHFEALTPLGVEAVAGIVTPHLAAFYESVYSGSLSVANYVSPAQARVQWYALADPPPRAPFIVPLGATLPIATSQIPTEVASVMSFQGDPISGQPQARRRGRIYIGMIPHAAIGQSGPAAFPTFTTAWISGITAGANVNLIPPMASDIRWAVWSPTDGQAVLVTNGWVDNSPDTQRRRSVDPSARTLFPPP